MSMTHVYGYNKLIYNEAADALAKAGAARSTVHRVARPRGPAGGEPQATKQKLVRARGVKRQAAVQTSDSETGSDTPVVIHHRRQHMRKTLMDIPDPERDW